MRRRDLEDTVELIIWRTIAAELVNEDVDEAAKEIIAKLIAIGALINVDDEVVIGGSR